MKRIRVLLAEDQTMVLGALAALLALEDDVEVGGQARHGKEALAAVLEKRAGYLRRAMTCGASGYVLKNRPAKELADAVGRVQQGLRVIDPELAAGV